MAKWCVVLLIVAMALPACDPIESADASEEAMASGAESGDKPKAAGLARVLEPPSAEDIADKRGTERLLGTDGYSGVAAEAPIDTLIEAYRKLGYGEAETISSPSDVRIAWGPWLESRKAVVLLQFKGQRWTQVISPALNAQQLSEAIGARVVLVGDSGWRGSHYELWTQGKKVESYQGNGSMPYRDGQDWSAPGFYSAFRDVDFKTIKMTDGQFINDFVKMQGAYIGLCSMERDYMGDRDEKGRPGMKLTWPHEQFPQGIIERIVVLQ